ncbi:MAG: carbohydrate-binding protein SusD [Bacteroidetes bacterium GWD2_45_23]|nr:MAG: carbohydrate-binding protein SusD [Bacteroidetes bacterium GWC2_46_850]OFX87530.1 MAG: carbohydrate-binding protein SusD [Bacteroidetes bacterium GWD2_45_23]HBB01526.1 RagB/SusD family nutrient uptake outer membrane protein [Porphyromonadaceae bacterium]HCC19025.1 RagB/SusD family nutrient uptake outer membrane protein [Porphyromonadaceae bacterium]
MRKIIFNLVTILTVVYLSSCEDFLTSEPIDKLVPGTFFQTEKDLALFSNSFYQRGIPDGLSVVQADEMADYTSKIQSPKFIAGAYDSGDVGSWNWSDLRNINYFLANFNNEAIPQEARNHYEGVARFWRAYFYYEKVKRYGDVPWYSKPLSTEDEDLYKPRDPRSMVMDSVLADLNFAAENIRDTKDNSSSLITRQVALAFKSRVSLFEGTFRKYHPEFNLQASANKFLEVAADAARKIMVSGKYAIYNTGNPDKDYRTLFISENPVNTEVMLAVVYNNALRRWHNITWKFNSATYGSRWGLNKQFVNTYLMTDGTRFTDKSGYDEILFVDEMENRDSRLAQTIRSLGYRRSDGSPAPPNFGYTYTGYHLLKFSLDDKSLDGTSEAYNSITLIRYGEVLLNYAEAMAELGRFDESIWNQTIAILRRRAGVNALPPVEADPYMQAVYFPAISDKYLLEIRRERGIELCYEGLRYDDLLRWKRGDLLEMSWKGIYVPGLDIPMDLDGNGTPDVSFVLKSPQTATPGVFYFVIDNKASRLSEGVKGNILWREDETRVFDEKKYLYPISENDIILNPALTQNPGWK